MTGIIMNPVTDDEVEAQRLLAEARVRRINEAKWVFKTQYDKLSENLTQDQKVQISLKAMLVNGYGPDEIKAAINLMVFEAEQRSA